MKRIAIINQRYGIEVNGGSEYYTRILAEKLNEIHDVTVLTTQAIDYKTWADYYKLDEENINGVKVKRFRVEKERNVREFSLINSIMLRMPMKIIQLEKKWLKEQGPYSLELLRYLEENQRKYDVIIFVTYLYYLTAVGMKIAPEKSILIPTAHEEPYIKFGLYKDVFEKPRGMVFLTEEEEKIVKTYFSVKAESCVAGMGIEIPPLLNGQETIEKYQLTYSYFVYVGRIDIAKGCDSLFRDFLEYKKISNKEIKLVVLGEAFMELPHDESIVFLGYVSENDKYAIIKHAMALIMPSLYESLSISVLEAMKLGTPAIVNGKCEVLKAHCVKSRSGAFYNNYSEFCASLKKYEEIKEKELLNESEHAKRYVENNFTWDGVLRKYNTIIEKVSEKQ